MHYVKTMVVQKVRKLMDDNIEIVIKISEKEYNGIKEDNSGMFGGHIYQAIKDGRKLSDYPLTINA